MSKIYQLVLNIQIPKVLILWELYEGARDLLTVNDQLTDLTNDSVLLHSGGSPEIKIPHTSNFNLIPF
jgi:hypothetical protein